MDGTLEALRALYVALGGTASDVSGMTYTPDIINAIATKAAALRTAATAKELPTVSSTDNGKVLTVVSGKWAKAALPN